MEVEEEGERDGGACRQNGENGKGFEKMKNCLPGRGET